MQQFLSEEFSARMLNHSRECFVDLATLLQKRAYDINYENSIELQKQLVRFDSAIGINRLTNEIRLGNVDLSTNNEQQSIE